MEGEAGDKASCGIERMVSPGERLTGRTLKERVLELLKSDDIEKTLEGLSHFPGRQTVNALFSFLYNVNQQIKWAAVTAMGDLVAKLAAQDMESARIILRRLMWNLNDESGGIGWGSPEAMAEILAASGELAKEYTPILVSYTRQDGNYLEHVSLQRGLIWGIGRLAQARPLLLKDTGPRIIPYIESQDTSLRGHSTWAMGHLGWKGSRPYLEPLTHDISEFPIYVDRRLLMKRVKDVAKEALERLPL